MQFVKMHSQGNDYIYLDYNAVKNYDLSTLAKKLSRRRFSIGSDGLIAVEKINGKTIKMYMYNADGSLGLTCGNGVRCSALFAKNYLGVNSDDITVITKSNVAFVKLFYSRGRVFAQSNMGKPIEEKIDNFNESLKKVGLYSDNQRIFPVNVGNRHLVCFTPEINLDSIVTKIHSTDLYPDGVNVERVYSFEKLSQTEYILKAEIFERGSGKTLSCGSGTVAIAYAFLKMQRLPFDDITINVVTEGGILQAFFDGGNCFLSGEITEVYCGFIGDIGENQV